MSNPRTGSKSPGIACLGGKHLLVDVYDAAKPKKDGIVVNWCLWCGGGVYDGDHITEDGEPVDFTPKYKIRVPEGFHRLESDAPPVGR